jgi:Retrotransposon gag protein
MSLITDELVQVVCTATLCCRNALARWAKNVLSSYCLYRVATRAVLHIFISIVCLGWSGRPVHLPGIVTLWTDFKTAFTDAFTDTAKKEDAYQKLKHLKMKGKLVDDYIMAFNSLVAKAGWELGNTGTIDAFHSGLRPGTLNAIMNRDVWPETMTQWQQAAQDEM